MTDVLPAIATAMNSSGDPNVLRTIGMKGVSLALWDRTLSNELTSALDDLPADRLPVMRRRLAVSQVRRAVLNACDEAGTRECAAELATGIRELASHAMAVFSSPLLEIRLQVAEGQPCPKWHVDAVPGRLLCTLRGPGTEYGALQPGGEPDTVHRMARGAVGVFRGALWPGRELAAIVHRSPPKDAGGTRLLVVIDPVDHAGTA